MDQLPNRVEELVAPTLDAMGYDLVRVRMIGTNRLTLEVMAERQDGDAMTVDDCADISRAVSAVLDVEDPIPGSYALEVSSPGIDRPLVRLADYERFAGFQAKLEVDKLIDGRKRFRGQLAGTKGDMVRIVLPEGEAEVPFDRIIKAKLVMSEDLIAATRKPGSGPEQVRKIRSTG